MAVNEALEAQAGETPDELLARAQDGEGGQTEDGTQANDLGQAPGEAADTPEAASKIKIGEEEYDLETLQKLVNDGRRALEIEKGGREKLEEAARLRKEYEAIETERQDLQDMRVIWNAWTNGTPDERRKILAQLETEVDSADLIEPTPNERLLHSQLQRAMAMVQHLQGQLGQVAPVLQDVKGFTEAERASRAMSQTIADLKTAHGIDATPDMIKAWKEQGIDDPVKAFGAFKPMMEAAMRVGAAKRAEKPAEAPIAPVEGVFDANDTSLTPDEVLKHLAAGHQPMG